MLGIDVSSHNGNIDGARLKRAGVEFCFIKLTEGSSYVNPYAVQQERACRNNGIKVGFYHFARPDNNSAGAEAAFFLSRLKRRLKPGDLLPALDFEHPPAHASWAYDFLSSVGKGIGANPILYTYPSFLKSMHAGRAITKFPLWLASYGPNDGVGHPATPVAPYTRIDIHQYTSNGKVDGSGKTRTDVNFASSLVPVTYKAVAPKPKRPDYLVFVGKDAPVRVKWPRRVLRANRLVRKAIAAGRAVTIQPVK